ncbi:hypothetical protein JTB14_017684 [Gonioctena quinquepunctata]|nr:hypothetical protein JTB14_017684 [Gonioctena quinquepunctata]
MFVFSFAKALIPSLKGQRPALIVCDGHQTHVSLNLVETARNENVHILLPPHLSHILQPLDLCVMESLKSAWDPELVKCKKLHIAKKVKSAFEEAGVVPFNREKVPETLFEPSALRRYKEKISKHGQEPATRDQDPATSEPEPVNEYPQTIGCLMLSYKYER